MLKKFTLLEAECMCLCVCVCLKNLGMSTRGRPLASEEEEVQ